MRLRSILVAASLAAGLAGVAAASGVDDHEFLFPALPCQDGWASCIVDGYIVDAGPSYDDAGRPLPADLRIGWFDGQPTSAFSPFGGLSEYTGKAVKKAAPPPKAAPTDKPVASSGGGDRPPKASSGGGDRPSQGGSGGSQVASNGGGDTRTDRDPKDPQGVGGSSSDVNTPPVDIQPTNLSDNGGGMQDVPLPDGDGDAVVDADPPPEQPPPPKMDPATCDDLIALEGPAMMGRLLPPQIACIERDIASSGSQTQKDKFSRVLLMNAEASGNKSEWERLMKRHLEDIDRSDPDLCFKYALHLSRGGVGRAWGVIKWADYALENKSRWSGTTYKTRVNSLYQLKAEAAVRLWENATQKVVEASGDDRDKLEQEEQKLRGMAKDYSLEWLDYARASGQDTQKAMTLCVTASGSKKFCKE